MTRIHLSFRTHDLQAAVGFYTTLFGAPPDKVRDGYARFQPGDVPVSLALMPGEPAPATDHLGVKLGAAGDTRAAWQRLVDAGLDVRTELETTCCWAVQNKAWVEDPDGREWEIYTVTDDQPATEREEGTACCL